MSLMYSVLFVVLSAASVSPQAYFLIKKKEFKTLGVLGGILAVAMVLGTVAIYRLSIPSFAELAVRLIPWSL